MSAARATVKKVPNAGLRIPEGVWRPSSGLLVYALVPILFIIGGIAIDGFTSFASARSMLVLASFLGIASIGQTLAVILGGIDLSVPALIGMADVMTTQLYGKGMAFGLVALIVLATAGALGACSGILSRALRAHSLIVTIAMSSIALGGVLAVTQGETGGLVPMWLTRFVSPSGHIWFVALPGVVGLWAVLAAVAVFLQRRMVLGRWIYGVGSNPVAAEMALVPTAAVYAAVFALSGVCAAIAGVLLAGFSGGADSSVGEPYLFTTIASVVVGGTSLVGGRGGYGRTIAGALLITELTTILVGIGASSPVQEMLLGGLILAMIAMLGRQASVREEI
jgi:ribose transport system permease protein